MRFLYSWIKPYTSGVEQIPLYSCKYNQLPTESRRTVPLWHIKNDQYKPKKKIYCPQKKQGTVCSKWLLRGKIPLFTVVPPPVMTGLTIIPLKLRTIIAESMSIRTFPPMESLIPGSPTSRISSPLQIT